MKDYYAVLSVARDADPRQIRSAFRQLAMSCHPDLADDPIAGERLFREIREAYETLIAPERREAYNKAIEEVDRQRRRGPRNATRPPFGPRQATVRPRQTQETTYKSRLVRADDPPADLSGTLEIPLEDTLQPTLYQLKLPEEFSLAGSQRINVHLPGKLHSGAELVVEGLPRGLRMQIALARHALFRVIGHNLFFDLTLQPWEAALGHVAQIPTLGDPVSLGLGPITSGPTLRKLEGQGLYREDGTRADLWVNLRTEIQPPTSYRARRLWAELAEEYRRQTKPH